MLIWMIHGIEVDIELPSEGTTGAGDQQGGASATTFLREEQPLPKCHPSLLFPCQDGGMAAKEGGGEQGAGVWWIYFHPCPRCGAEPWTPPGVMQLLGIKTLTSETLISNGKEFQGCCGRILCHRLPLPRIGIHLGKGEVSLGHSSLQKQPTVCADGPQHVWGTQESVLPFPQPLRFVLGIPRASSGSLHFVDNTKLGSRVAIQQDGV